MGGTIKVARIVHLISAFWTLAIAVLIFLDVMGLTLFGSPVPGTKEIIQNSVVSITFLQLPLAIYSGSMLRTSILSDAVPKTARRVLRTLASLLGIVVFLFIAWSTLPAFLDAYRIGEYEGEGALRVATWPVRGLVLITSVFGAWAYLCMIIYDWQDRLRDELEAPGSLPPALIED